MGGVAGCQLFCNPDGSLSGFATFLAWLAVAVVVGGVVLVVIACVASAIADGRAHAAMGRQRPARRVAHTAGCLHGQAVPVDLLAGGERVAWWCPDCERQLPASWRGPQGDDMVVERIAGTGR